MTVYELLEKAEMLISQHLNNDLKKIIFIHLITSNYLFECLFADHENDIMNNRYKFYDAIVHWFTSFLHSCFDWYINAAMLTIDVENWK